MMDSNPTVVKNEESKRDECDHGDPRCPGSAVIAFVDGEPVCEGRLPCVDCFMAAHRDRSDETAATDTTQPARADGGQELTALDAGLTVSDETGETWTIDTPVEQRPTPRGDQPRTRLVSETGEITRITPRTFVEAVEAETGEFSLVEGTQ